jgi:hypothetical protein
MGVLGLGGPGGAGEEQSANGALVHHVETGFVAVQQGEPTGIGQFAERAGHTGGIISVPLASEGAGHEAVFDGPRAAHTPVRGDHFLDHAHFEVISRAEAGEVGIFEGLKRLQGFVGHDHDIGKQTMTGCIPGGTALAFGGFGAAGVGAIGAGGLTLFFGNHMVQLAKGFALDIPAGYGSRGSQEAEDRMAAA